ncbi:MAG: M16 family metallopeptidase [Thiotrichales bacterium]
MTRWILLGIAMCLSSWAHAGPAIQHWTTENGLRVYFVPAKDIPMLDIRVTFAAGSARDGDKSGIASLTNSMLAQGADGLSADQIATAFENVGAQFSAGARRDMAWLSLRSLSDPDFLQPALDAFAQVLWHPDFPERDFERLKKQTLLSIKAEEAEPSSIAEKAFFKAVYGDHPYASPSIGTNSTVAGLTREDLSGFYHQFYVANNGLLAMTGDIDRQTAEKLAEILSSGLKAGKAAGELPPVKPLSGAVEKRIPFPSQQAHVLVGQPGVERGNPDYYALYLGNHVLGGGGFTSRLVKEVRVARGYAYSVYSYFLPMDMPGPFLVGLQTRGSQVDDALTVVRENLQRFIDDGPEPEEIKASRKNITGGFPLRIASNQNIVEYLAMIGFYELPLGYLDDFTAKINDVSRKDITRAFKKYLNPEKMVTIVVGGEEKN